MQKNLGIHAGAAFDLQAVCTGFVYALSTADAMLRAGQGKRALVIGAETFSRILDWTDRTTCVLFGDGAGALVLEAAEGKGTIADRGVLDLASSLRRRAQGEALRRRRALGDRHGRPCPHGGARGLQACGRHDLRRDQCRLRRDRHDAPTTSTGSCRTRPISASSMRAPRSSALPTAKVVSTVARHGNTSAASIPLALDVAVKDGRIKPGNLVMLEAMGGGFTWGSALVRW